MATGIKLSPSAGPTQPPSSTPHVGLLDGPVWRYLLPGHPAEGSVELSPHEVGEGEHLRLAVYPQLQTDLAGRCDFGSADITLALEFADGTEPATDQHGHRGGCLVVDQWNWLELDLSQHVGRQLTGVIISGTTTGVGWIQPIGVATDPSRERPIDWVETTRGSHSRFDFSRGNTFPATCVPHGMNFVTPVTDARTNAWIYTWHGDPNPKMQAFAISHQASPWIGDRSALQVMPFTGEPEADPEKRALSFRHEDEEAGPHRYRVTLENDLVCELTATCRVAAFRFTWPSDETPRGALLDWPSDEGELSTVQATDGTAEITGWVPDSTKNRPDQIRCYIYGHTLQPVEMDEALTLREGNQLEVRLATSFISVDQARHTYELEAAGKSFDDLVGEADAAWSEVLESLELPGASDYQKLTAYSNLYRAFCYPNAAYENSGTAEEPMWVHASPVRPLVGEHSDTETGCDVVPGKIYVNNGYWDTYRTLWPLHNLAYPKRAAELTDGILYQYRDSGWMSRWSAPGHVEGMVGTSSDSIFADASAHGIEFDELTAYDSAVRNATAVSTESVTGRKGISRGRFVGYIDTDTREGFSWSMHNAQDNAALSIWSSRLAAEASKHGSRWWVRVPEFRANARYFANQALSWRKLFNFDTGFLQGKRPDGAWRTEIEAFDPRVWGGDYTETNAWGMSLAPVFDGRGLAEAYQEHARYTEFSRKPLAEHMERLCREPEEASEHSAVIYERCIHEMVEARALRMGMVGLSNQPAHHIPYMWLYTDEPWRASEMVHDALERAFVGSEIGQGWPGDEDNGEFACWWLFAAMGLYPLVPGSGELVITACWLPEVIWRRDSRRELRIKTTGIGPYVGSVKINGEPWYRPTIEVARLQDDCLIEVDLAESPTTWGWHRYPASLSERYTYQPDLSENAHVASDLKGADALISDSADEVFDVESGDWVSVVFDAETEISWYTLTADGDTAWAVSAWLNDEWIEIVRERAAYRWQNQTRPFAFPKPVTTTALRFTAKSAGAWRQIELFAK